MRSRVAAWEGGRPRFQSPSLIKTTDLRFGCFSSATFSVVKRALWTLLLLVVVLGSAWTWVALNWAYSDGDRAGVLQKFSRKGWLCKTWEGEMAMVSMPGTAPEIFNFSVRSDAVAEKINRSLGKRVAISYEQHKGVPTRCFGETEYFITDVKPVE